MENVQWKIKDNKLIIEMGGVVVHYDDPVYRSNTYV